LLIGAGRILAITRDAAASSSAARVLDARDGVVTAGFWNAHVHLLSQNLLNAEQRTGAALSDELERMLTRWGFTAIFDTASILSNTNVIRERIENGDVRGPTILTAGEPFYPVGGTPEYVRLFLRENRLPSFEAADRDAATARARQQLSVGADGLKVFTGAIVGGEAGVQVMESALARAIVDAAHAAGKVALAHPSNLEGLNVAIDAGVDVLAHAAPMAGLWDRALIGRLQQQRMALIPTLALFGIEARRSGASPAEATAVMATAQQQLRGFSESRGEVLFGTDIGYTDMDDTREEFRLMQAAGLDVTSILASLTTNPARRFGFSARKGLVAPGMDADLVVLDGDPAHDIEALARVRHTIKGGEVIFSAV
jgi:imidazolonepropionase-like amidohydrolase